MPPKKSKGLGRKKNKTLNISVDPDEPFRLSLDESWYIPKRVRECITASYLRRIDLAIKAFTLAQPPIDSTTFEMRETKICQEIAALVPMTAVPHIVRALGFNPNTQQMRQIGWLVLSEHKPPLDPMELTESVPSLANQPPQEPRDTIEEMREEMMMDSCISVTDSSMECNVPVLMADRRKLEMVAIDMLRTGILVYDPTKVDNRVAKAATPHRVASKVERGDSVCMDDAFDVLWSSLRGGMCDGQKTRYISTREIRKVLERRAAGGGEEPSFTPEEINSFLHHVSDVHSETLREDTFALTAYCGS